MTDGNAERVKTALYRYFDADGKLLYVGISLSPTYRQSQHRDASPWYERIARMQVEWFESRRLAMDAERYAIQSELPECNIVHKRQVSARAAYLEELAEESCAELTRKVTRFSPAYSIKDAAGVLGTSESALRLALAAMEIPYYPSGGSNVSITGWALIAYMEALQAGVLSVQKPLRADDGRVMRPPTGEWLANNHGSTSIAAWLEYLSATRDVSSQAA